ncbi:hypothetical protein L1887_03795 [Cichorium endivia]|nr:hypothetical protein L1887_03795 [Cichorium endivia]
MNDRKKHQLKRPAKGSPHNSPKHKSTTRSGSSNLKSQGQFVKIAPKSSRGKVNQKSLQLKESHAFRACTVKPLKQARHRVRSRVLLSVSISAAVVYRVPIRVFLSIMEEITEAVNNINISSDSYKKNRIQVSNTKKPLFFYVNLAKRYMQQHNEVELSALGMAIATVVTVAEILKNNGFAVEKKIMTSTVEMKGESRGRPVQKAKIEIVLGKTANFDELMAAAQEERELGYAEEQN